MTDEFKLLELVGEVLDECASMMKTNRDDVNWMYLSGEVQRIATDTGAKKEQVIDLMIRMSQSPSRLHVGKQIEPVLRATGVATIPIEPRPSPPAPIIVYEAKPASLLPHEQAALDYIRNLAYRNVWPNSSMACAELAMLLLKCYNEYYVPVDKTLDTVYDQAKYAQGVESWSHDLATMLDGFRGYDVEGKH
jgi:hypothetical protein